MTKNGRSRTIVFDDALSWSAACYRLSKMEEAQRGGFLLNEYTHSFDKNKKAASKALQKGLAI